MSPILHTLHLFKYDGAHGGIAEASVIIMSPQEWDEDPRSKNGRWSSCVGKLGRKKVVIASSVVLTDCLPLPHPGGFVEEFTPHKDGKNQRP